MAFKDLREYIAKLEEEGELQVKSNLKIHSNLITC